MHAITVESMIEEIRYVEDQIDEIESKIKNGIQIRDNETDSEVKRIYRRYVNRLEKIKQSYVVSLLELKAMLGNLYMEDVYNAS